MKVLVLGSAAGGGFPQWNCNCYNCRGARDGSLRTKWRTQSSIAVSSDNRNWVLINASPDLLAQFKTVPQLQPGHKLRDTGISAVILVDSQLDHTLGLAMMREGQRLRAYCTSSVRSDLITGNPVFRILESYCGVDWHEVKLEESFQVPGIDHLDFTGVPVESKAPPYSPHRNEPREDDNIALVIRDLATDRSLFYAPCLASVDSRVWECMTQAACVLVDGTFWSDDEMIRLSAGRKRAIEMGHLALCGQNGMLSYLGHLSDVRKVLIHINNTNPILDEDSAERRAVEEAGMEIAYDGMEIDL